MYRATYVVDDIVKWGSSPSVTQKSLADVEREVKNLAPFLFSMKLRIGPVHKMLGKLYKRIQTLHNSAALADKNLRETRESTELAKKENELLRNLVREIGMQLPYDLTGTTTVRVTQKQAVQLLGVAKELIIWHGEKQLEGEGSEHAMFDEVSPHPLPDHDYSMGTRVPHRSRVAKAMDMFKSGLVSADHVAKMAGIDLASDGSKPPNLKTLRQDIEAECSRQGYTAHNLKLYMSDDKMTLHVDTSGLVSVLPNPTVVFDREPLKALFGKTVPVNVYIETPLL